MAGSALSAEELKSPSSTGSLEFTPKLRLDVFSEEVVHHV